MWGGGVAVIIDIVRHRAIRKNSYIPYIVSFPQCMCWVFYAIVTPNRLQPLVTNIIGSSCFAIYLVIFLWFSRDEQRRKLLMHMTILALAMAVLVIFTVFAIPKMTFIPVRCFVLSCLVLFHYFLFNTLLNILLHKQT